MIKTSYNIYEGKEKIIAYCIPVMNRVSDLKTTLNHNLEVVEPYSKEAQLIIACFDKNEECKRWIHNNYPEQLKCGILRFHSLAPLPYWHFSWAKNSFKNLISARYYSSLDGDNFLSQDELEKTLNLLRNNKQHYLIHHFSGQWGDGTCGRITFPTFLYNKSLYLNDILPRQFDEIGVILRLLTYYPDLIFVSRTGVDIFEKSGWCRDYLKLNGLTINRKEVDFGSVVAPVKQKGHDYLQACNQLFYFEHLNANYTLWKLSLFQHAKNEFKARLEGVQRAFSNSESCYNNISMLFSSQDLDKLNRTGEITLYAVNRNNYEYLLNWIDHYRKLGVKRFIIVDDGSDISLREFLDGNDIFIVRPTFGTFKTSKAFWLRILMGAFQEPGSWVVTVDVDEFLDIAQSQNTQIEGSLLDNLIEQTEHAGFRQIPGLLLDMMPSPKNFTVRSDNFLETMNWHFFRPASKDLKYHNLKSVQWAFGDHWHIPLSVDIRYRLYGTVDCLRKVPIFRFDEGTYLNQGFHTLLRNEVELNWKVLLGKGQGLIPIRHYKLAKVFWSRQKTGNILERSEQYFERTRQNLQKITSTDISYVLRSWRATPFKRKYNGPDNFPYYYDIQSRLPDR